MEQGIQRNDILWHGKPKQGFQLIFEDIIIIPFILFFGVVVYIAISSMNNASIGIFTSLSAMGCLIYFRYIKEIIKRRFITYEITSKKIIIRKSYEEIVLPFSSINKISFKEHPFSYNYGSVIFGEEQNIFGPTDVPFRFGAHRGLNLERDKVAIDFIKDYKEVYNLILTHIPASKNANKR